MVEARLVGDIYLPQRLVLHRHRGYRLLLPAPDQDRVLQPSRRMPIALKNVAILRSQSDCVLIRDAHLLLKHKRHARELVSRWRQEYFVERQARLR